MKLALGTVQFGLNYGVANAVGQVSPPDISGILNLARSSGIDTIDTAAAYGDSEVRLGQAEVADFKIVTKLPPLPENEIVSGSWVRGQIEASLARLGVPSVYGYLMHRPDQLAGSPGEMIAGALREAKQDGLVSRIGISIYDPEQIPLAMEQLDLDLVQAPLNLVDRRIVDSGWTQRLQGRGVELHTRSSFLQGLLLMNRDAIPPYFSRWSNLLDRWHDWIESARVPAAQACLDFVTSIAEVHRVVVGVDTRNQLAMLVGGMGGPEDLAPSAWPDVQCGDADLINPARWSLN